MAFDFEAAVTAPFRMQPGLRRRAPGAVVLTPMLKGTPHHQEKLAVLSSFWQQALLLQEGFDATPALHALLALAAQEHPQAWQWDGQRAVAWLLNAAVDREGRVEQLGGPSGQPSSADPSGAGDKIVRCLLGLPAHWRLVGLLSLAFAQDFAILNGQDACIPWLAVTLPSHWAPETKLGQHFATVHAPVADNALLLKAAESLTRLVCGPERWERFVWNVTDQPQLHAHPLRAERERWQDCEVAQAYWRTEHQSFLPLPHLNQALFMIDVQVQPLRSMLAQAPARALVLHDALASMSPEVLAYRGLQPVREPLLAWLRGWCSERTPTTSSIRTTFED